MREAHPIEREVGIEYYASDSDGTGGRLRVEPEDFRVREIEWFEPEPLDADPGSYPHVVLRATLRAWDTNDFARRLSDALGVSRERVSWAGTKDKHAVTTQLFSVRDVDPDAIPEIDDADVEVLGRAGRAIEFGDLSGNAFDVRVRDPERAANADAITDELAAFGGEGGASGDDADAETVRIGVPNVFGQQRFGSRRPVTHVVGLHVVRGEWREAVRAYAGNPAETEPDGTQKARAFVDEQFERTDPDWQTAVDRLPGRLRFERAMLHRLVETDAGDDGGNDEAFRNALEAVPSNLQRLFVNAAQSYVFNRVLSERMARGLPFDRPVAGDVVCFTERDAPGEVVVPDTDRTQQVTERRVETITRHCERGRAFVTAPLVGTETTLTDGEPGDIEREVLADLDLEPADFDLPGNFHSFGTRRAILLRTDLSMTQDPLRFSFALPRGAYATVVLREYLKTSPLEL